MSFQAVVIRKDDQGYRAAIEAVDESDLPPGEVLVEIAHSNLNYKDGLAITGKGPVVRSFPMVAGIDFAGTVLESSSDLWRPGDKVILNGWGVGEGHWGGLAQRARVKADWLIPQPEALTSLQAMAIGTAGYTAMLCVQALETHGVAPGGETNAPDSGLSAPGEWSALGSLAGVCELHGHETTGARAGLREPVGGVLQRHPRSLHGRPRVPARRVGALPPRKRCRRRCVDGAQPRGGGAGLPRCAGNRDVASARRFADAPTGRPGRARRGGPPAGTPCPCPRRHRRRLKS